MSNKVNSHHQPALQNRDEPNWGNPTERQPRKDFSVSERRVATVWLCLAAVVSLVIEIVYLGSRITLGEYSVAFPWTIALAAAFNWVLMKTSRLWWPSPGQAMWPLVVWILGCVLAMLWPVLPFSHGDILVAGSVRFMLLFCAGILGGINGLYSIKGGLATRTDQE